MDRKSEYADARWQKKRLETLERCGWQQKQGDTTNFTIVGEVVHSLWLSCRYLETSKKLWSELQTAKQLLPDEK